MKVNTFVWKNALNNANIFIDHITEQASWQATKIPKHCFGNSMPSFNIILNNPRHNTQMTDTTLLTNS